VQDARATLRGFSPPYSSITYGHRHVDHAIGEPALAISPNASGTTKRIPDDAGGAESNALKRQRTAPYNDNHPERAYIAENLDDQRRASDTLLRTEPFRTYSPAQSDSWASTVYPQQQSPSFYGRSLKPLPSPSSLAPASQKALWSGPTVPHADSPTSDHQGLPSIHTAPTSSAASQHIADLQHQVTLKSLSLQTLQSEYTSLLQKSQRDSLKSQTFEKKTVAADQEINELTIRNEDFVEQVRTLETQLEECEKKREMERSDAVREKDQWSRILEMSGRLQAKSADDRQKLIQDKENLQQRLLIYENEAVLSAKRSTSHSHKVSPLAGRDGSNYEANRQTNEDSKEAAMQVAALQQENDIWRRRTQVLRNALEQMEQQYSSLVEKRRRLMEEEMAGIPDLQMALQEDCELARPLDRWDDETRLARRDVVQIVAGRRPSHVYSPQPTDNRTIPQVALLGDREIEKALLRSSTPTNAEHSAGAKVCNTAHDSRDGTEPKTASRPKLQALPLPKWQPPNMPVLQTEYLYSTQRRPSGPTTPFPRSEAAQRRASEGTSAPTVSAPPDSKLSSPPQGVLPSFSVEKLPAPNHTPQFVKSSQTSTTGSGEVSKQDPPVVTMPPPPPRPESDVPSTSTAAAWRPS
jgi:hypothetical protein